MSEDNFNVLSFVHEQRMQHGLKRNDFSVYFSYCNRRLAALRFRASGRTRKTLTHYQKTQLMKAHKSTRKSVKPFYPPKIESVDNMNSLQTLIYLIERDWAASQFIRSEIETMNFSISAKKRHSINKLARAVSNADKLYQLKPELPFAIYYQVLKGEYSNYKFDHKSAFVSFSIAKKLLDNLKKHETNISNFDNYLDYFSEFSTPIFNYSKFLLETQKTDLSQFDQEIEEESSKLIDTFKISEKSGIKFEIDGDVAFFEDKDAEKWRKLIDTKSDLNIYNVKAHGIEFTVEAETYNKELYSELVVESEKLQNLVSKKHDVTQKTPLLVVLKLLIRRKAAQKEAKCLEICQSTSSLRKICDNLMVCDDCNLIMNGEKTRFLSKKTEVTSQKYAQLFAKSLHRLAEINNDDQLMNKLADKFSLGKAEPRPVLPEAPRPIPNPILFDLASDLLPSEEELNAGLVNKIFGMFKK